MGKLKRGAWERGRARGNPAALLASAGRTCQTATEAALRRAGFCSGGRNGCANLRRRSARSGQPESAPGPMRGWTATSRSSARPPPCRARPGDLAALLVRDGFLTPFQADHLMRGRRPKFLIGKYLILDRIGAGGMGAVYLCEHLQLERQVALKVLPADQADDPASSGPLLPRGPGGRRPEPSEHRPGLRRGRGRADLFPRHGIRGRRQPARLDDQARPARPGARRPLRPSGGRRVAARPQSPAWSTATSSRPTCCSVGPASSRSSTWAWRGSSTKTPTA